MRTWIACTALALLTVLAPAQAQTDQNLSGEITRQAPRRTFQVQLQAGEVVTLTTTSRSHMDTVLALNGPGGRQVAVNDDAQPGVLTSRIVYVAAANGTYTAVVSGFNGATGVFDLNITRGLDVGLSAAARTLREERITVSAQRPEARFNVDLTAGDIFVASTFGLADTLDTTLTLLDRNGNVLTQNDDRGDGSLNSQLIYEVADTGRYTVVASTYDRTGVGEMIVSLATDPQAEAPFNFASIDGTQFAQHEGTINAAHTSQEYRVDLAAGQTVLALADATSGDLDPVLRLTEADGSPVAANDDRGDGSLNSALAFTAPRAGRYTLTIERYRNSDSAGGYRIVLSSVAASVVSELQAIFENPVRLSGPEQTIETADFRVLYTTEGEDASTPEYARLVADTLQSTFETQVRRAGWAEPPRDSDGRFRAYVADAEGNMGYTKPVQITFDNPNTPNVRESAAARALLVIENDFAHMNKPAPPESLMRATVAHEFNHVIQFGYDGEEPLGWLYEATASWMETAAAGDDQDATDYVETDYAAPQRCWTTRERGFDYSQWTLLQSLADQYGDVIVKRLWENSVRHDGFETMSQTLAGAGSTIPEALERWRAQNFARDYRLAPRFTRTVRREHTLRRAGSWDTKSGIEQLGAHYIELRMDGRYEFSLEGDSNLELVGLGRRGNEVQVVRLGRRGVFEPSSYEYAALMVFNRAVPATPGDCRAASYALRSAASTGAVAAPAYHFSAAHFAPPS